MSRRLLVDLRAGQVFTRLVERGKCRYGPRHESVRMTDGEWWGESSGHYECELAPPDPCQLCQGRGFHEVRGAAAEQAEIDGHPTEMHAGEKIARKPCPPCRGSGWQPGPHWPYRHEQPPPLRPRE
jgi:hypothetical protein